MAADPPINLAEAYQSVRSGARAICEYRPHDVDLEEAYADGETVSQIKVAAIAGIRMIRPIDPHNIL